MGGCNHSSLLRRRKADGVYATMSIPDLSTVFLPSGKTVRILINEDSPKDSFGLSPADVDTIRAEVGTQKDSEDYKEVRVRRAGATVILHGSDVVPGDVVLLTCSTPCPAYVRLLSSEGSSEGMKSVTPGKWGRYLGGKEPPPNMRGVGDDLGFESAVGLVVMNRKQLSIK